MPAVCTLYTVFRTSTLVITLASIFTGLQVVILNSLRYTSNPNIQGVFLTGTPTPCPQCSLTDSHRRMLGDLTSQSSACTCNPPLEPSSNRPPVLLGFSSNNHQIMRHCNGVGDDGEQQ